MFAGLENVGPNPRRGWTALVSFTLQATIVATALTVPLLYPNALPDAFARRRIFVPISNPVIGDSNPNPRPGINRGFTSPINTIFVVHDTQFRYTPPGPTSDSVDSAPSLPPGLGIPNGLRGIATIDTAAPLPLHPVIQPVRVSRAMQSYLIRRVEPAYPNIAKLAGVQGAVLIKAIISTEGKIEQAQVVSGSPLLSPAALDAIRQWRYRPYLLNDKPV